MCKILTFSNVSKVKNLDKLISQSAAHLAAYEQDGFGYAVLGEYGVFGERHTEPDNFKPGHGKLKIKIPFARAVSNYFGKKGLPIGAAMFHGRTSTNDLNLLNTHPIQKNNWTLIHNGVVTNHGPKYKMTTTNDTEHLVHYLSTTGVKGIEEHLSGYYAISAIDPQGKLHVMRDSRATLYCAYIKHIDSFVFATTPDLISDVCKAMKWKTSEIQKVNDNTYFVLERTDIISCSTIKPRGESWSELQYAGKSLGYDVDKYIDSTPAYLRETKESNYRLYDDYPELYSMSDEELFLREVKKYADNSWSFTDMKGTEYSYEEFSDMPDDQKIDMIVVRPDGSACLPYDYSHSNRGA